MWSIDFRVALRLDVLDVDEVELWRDRSWRSDRDEEDEVEEVDEVRVFGVWVPVEKGDFVVLLLLLRREM